MNHLNINSAESLSTATQKSVASLVLDPGFKAADNATLEATCYKQHDHFHPSVSFEGWAHYCVA